jgi:hypothetical protein
VKEKIYSGLVFGFLFKRNTVLRASIFFIIFIYTNILYAQEVFVSSFQGFVRQLELQKSEKTNLPASIAPFTKDFIYKGTLELSVSNDLPTDETFYLHIGTDNIFKFSSIDLVRSVRGMTGIVALEIQERQQIYYNGYLTPIPQRQYAENLQVFSVKIPPKQTYHLRLHIFDLVKGSLPNIKIMNSSSFIELQNEFIRQTKTSVAFSYFYVGAISVIFIFILAIYSQNKLQDFGLYALYLLGILFFGILDMYPLNFKSFWGWHFPKIFIYLKESSVYLYLIFYHAFLTYFLQTKTNKISLHKGLYGGAVLYAILLIINLISILFFFEAQFVRNLTWVNTFVFYGSIIFYIYLFVMIWKLKQIPFSRYIFWGTFIFYLSNVIAIIINATTRGTYNLQIFPNSFIQIGVIVEILFFSVALGRKTLLDSEEKNKLQKQVIEQLEDKKQLVESINERLEKEVNEKTEEILIQTQKLQTEKEEKIRLQYGKQLQEIRLYAIQTQLNPHFLFNCLNTIKSLVINQENEKAATYLSQFAKLMRSTLENSEKLKINLKESIEYLKNYVEMEKLRFKEDFDFEISFKGEEDPEILQVPPMLIQPFVENAIIHGLVPLQKNKMLKIEFVEEENFLICRVIDNGKGFTLESKNNTHNSKGLKMIQTYFDLWNAQKTEKAFFVIDTQQDKGTSVIIQIPI